MMSRAMREASKNLNYRTDPAATSSEEILTSHWIKAYVEELIRIISYGVTPVMVFDGIKIEGKAATQKDRKEKKQAIQSSINELERKLDSQDPFERSDADIEELRRKKNSVPRVGHDRIDELKSVLDMLGIPHITAAGDGEKLCCALLNCQAVSAVMSKDVDCIVYAAPVVITGFDKETRGSDKMVNVTYFAPILNDLGLNYSSFIDFCILRGCDYNEGIKGIGIVYAYNLIKKHGCIEDLPETFKGIKLDQDVLNYKDCRRYFAIESAVDLIAPSQEGSVATLPNLNINPFALREDHVRPTLRLYKLTNETSLENLVSKMHAAARNITETKYLGVEHYSEMPRFIINNDHIMIINPVKEDTPKIPKGFRGLNNLQGSEGSEGSGGPSSMNPLDYQPTIPLSSLKAVDPVSDLMQMRSFS